MDLMLVLPPLIGAVIGWLTNFVAIKLLFRPHNPVNIFGLRVQGLIPKRRRAIAVSIANTIEKELFSSSDVARILEGIDWRKEVEMAVDEAVDQRLDSGKLKKVPVLGLFSDNLKGHVKTLITKEVLKHLNKKKDGLKERFHSNMDVREIVTSRIDALDMKKFEEMLHGIITRELKHLEWLGGLMGFLIGIVQAIIYFFLYRGA